MSLPLSANRLCRQYVAPAVFSGALLFSCVGTANAETALSFSSLVTDYKDEDYRTYGYFAQEIVSSANSLAAGLGRLGHDKLKLSEKSQIARWAYLASAVHLQIRVQWANSLYFGHEFSHFATAHHFGRNEHFFRDYKNGEEIKFKRAYMAIVKGGDVGGAAVSRGKLDAEQEKRHQEEGLISTTAGLNWQMNYSESWVRHHYAFGKKDFFDAPEFFLNRSYLSAYAYGDRKRRNNEDITGDVLRWAEHIATLHPEEVDALDKAAKYSLAANILSPSFWSSFISFGDYLSTGDTVISDPYLNAETGGFIWDLPHYLNLNSMTVAPTVYWRPSNNTAGQIGARNLLVGAGAEVPVIGDDEEEYRISVTGQWQDFDVDFGIATSTTGHFSEIGLAYNINKNFALTAGAAYADGKTLRGRRNFPHGHVAGWLGVQVSF